ncbi:MAG: transcriptional repressor [Candidatus Omnitrophica bacterium]|nr:transcriptional repressor [Candidatus Omnitrophota bacterium]
MRGRQGYGWLQGRLRHRGYRMTLARQAALQVLSRTRDHLSAEEIYQRVQRISPSVGIATVYRTLEMLTELGLVFKFDFGDGRARYELSRGPEAKDHHHHLVCTHCGRVIDYTDFIDEEVELLNKTERHLAKKYRFDIRKHILQFYGVCNECRKQG